MTEIYETYRELIYKLDAYTPFTQYHVIFHIFLCPYLRNTLYRVLKLSVV